MFCHHMVSLVQNELMIIQLSSLLPGPVLIIITRILRKESKYNSDENYNFFIQENSLNKPFENVGHSIQGAGIFQDN